MNKKIFKILGKIVAGYVWGSFLIIFLVVSVPFLFGSLFIDRNMWNCGEA